MIYKGSSLGVISLSYQRFAQKGFHKLRIYYDQVKVESTELITFPTFGGPVTRDPSTASFINIQYQYAHYVLQKDPIHLAIGAMLDSYAHLMEYIFGLSDDEGFIFAYSLSFLFRGEYQIDDRQSLFVDTSFPLISFVARPSYAIVDNGEIQYNGSDIGYLHDIGKWKWPGKLINLHLGINYQRVLSSRIDMLFGYQFRYLKFNDPIRISVLKHSLDFGFNFNF